MTKKRKLVKEALKNPELFSKGELVYFERWLYEKKKLKKLKKGTRDPLSGEFTDPTKSL